jgi:DNA-binding MarR family transcriptional regulator
MHDPLSEYPGYVLRRASSAMMAAFARDMEGLGLRTVDATILQILQENPGISQSALGRMLDIQRANMTPIAARLEARGLVQRSPSDGRSLGLELSAEGKILAHQVRERVEAFEADVLASVPSEHRGHILPALQSIWQRFGG